MCIFEIYDVVGIDTNLDILNRFESESVEVKWQLKQT